MKNRFLYFFLSLFVGIVLLFQYLRAPVLVAENVLKPPARILLFTCHYGAGHKMATQSILESLSGYEVQVVDIYDQPLASLDPMRSWAPALSNERIYNDLIKKEENQLLNLAGTVAPQFLLTQKKKMEELLLQYISKDKPDMLISCVPLVNSPLLNVANELEIPLLVITTDIDISDFCFGLPEDLEENRSYFGITVPFEKGEWDELFAHRLSPSAKGSFLYGFGYPTRRAFSLEPTDAELAQLRDEYEIEQDENVILIMMGGNAGHASRGYADLLMEMDDEALDRIVGKESLRNKIHLICLCGDVARSENKEFMDSLNRYERGGRVRIHGCPGTPKIGELVSLPELSLVISKPGGSTVNEMIKKRVPMIYHTSKSPLRWEKGNMEYGEARGLGRRFVASKRYRSSHLPIFTGLLVEAFAKDRAIRSGKLAVPEAEIDFSSNLRKTVKRMLSSKS